jgi:hypothetical protein
MNASSAAAHAFAKRFASVSVCADMSHVANAASFALLTAVAASRYAAASCSTVGVGAGVADDVGVAAASGADDVGVAAASGADDVGVAAASGADDVGVAAASGASLEAAGGLVGATAGDPDDRDNQPVTDTAKKTTTVTMTNA